MSTTHFGFQSVDEQDKARHVRGVFDSVASKYDVMNDLMSAGLHRAWKAYTVLVANLREGSQVLDIAGGTGDLARAFAKKVGTTTTAWYCLPWCATQNSCLFLMRISTWLAWPSACAT